MLPTPAHPMPMRARGALAAAALALFGLVAMHGLGTHGTIAQPASMAGVSVPADAAQPMADHTCDCPHVHGEGPDSTHGMLALCLAVLAGLLAMAVRQFVIGVTWAPVTRRTRAHLPDPPLRDRDPPNLLALCVIRC